MKGRFASRRRAEAFDTLVSQRTSSDDVDAEFARLLEVVGAMRAVPEVSARPQFVADLRERLVAEAAAMPARTDEAIALRLTPNKRVASRERRLATLIGGVAAATATGSMAIAAQGALPGDVLYPMKRTIETAEVNLASSDAERAAVLIEHAQVRLTEVAELSARDGADEEISETLQAFTDDTNQATDLVLDGYREDRDAEPVRQLRDFTDGAMDELVSLGEVVPEAARPALVTAAQTVRSADAAAWNACPYCAPGLIVEEPDLAAATIDPGLLSGAGDLAEDAEAAASQHPADEDGTSGTALPGTPATDGGTTDEGSDRTSDSDADAKGDGSTDGEAKQPVEDVTEGVEDVTGTTDDTVDGVGGAVDGVTDAVDAIVSGLLGTP